MRVMWGVMILDWGADARQKRDITAVIAIVNIFVLDFALTVRKLGERSYGSARDV